MEITNEYMQQMLVTTKPYSIVILKPGPNISMPGVEKLIWEHGRNNFRLRAEGLLSIVCPVINGTDVRGVGIFNADVEATKKLMDDDPGVKEGIFLYDVFPCRSFPGDCLPK